MRANSALTRPRPGLAFASLPSLAPLIIFLAVAGALVTYLASSPIEFPMDDAYIHFVYAQNLARRGALFFNDPSEQGVGTSSLLWVVLLAAGDRLGLSIHLLAKLMGGVSLWIVGVGGFALLRRLVQPGLALAAILALVLSGHMLWFALNGMETMLFLALAVAALWSYREERWLLLGLLLGLLVLTRVEGAALALAIAAVDVWRRRGLRPSLGQALLISALLGGAWLAYLFLRTGHWLPTSGLGKHFSGFTVIQVGAQSRPDLSLLAHFPWLAYPAVLIPYLLEFALGGAALPPPYLSLNTSFGGVSFQISLWAFVGWLGVVLPLCLFSLRAAVRARRRPWPAPDHRWPFAAFFVWLLLHNLSYMIYLPSIGHASRYAAPNHLLLWPALVMVLCAVRGRAARLWLSTGLLILAAANTLYWHRVYDANLEHMVRVRVAAANWLPVAFTESETCAAADIGAVRYFSQRPVVDLGGLIDPNLPAWYLRDQLDRYLVHHGVTCLVLPGRAGSTDDGAFDVARELGLNDSQLFGLHPLYSFQITRERWLQGYLPVVNYQARVTVYRLLPSIASVGDSPPQSGPSASHILRPAD